MLTRRAFVVRSGAIVGALSLGSVGRGVFAAPAAAAPGFTDARRQVYVALVEAVGTAPDNQVDADKAAEAADSFATFYADRAADLRAAIDSGVDLIENGPSSRFSSMTAQERLTFLRSWLRGSNATTEQITAAARAVELAAVPFYPDPVEFHPTPVVI